jgi:hypothetical protein
MRLISGWHRKLRCFQHGQVLLKPSVFFFSVRPVVDLPVAIGADRADPSGVVRSAVGQPPGVVGLQVGGPVFPAEGGRVPARLAGAVRPGQYVRTHPCASLVVEAPGLFRVLPLGF